MRRRGMVTAVTAKFTRAVASGYQPCPAQASPLAPGVAVWSVQLAWGIVSGTAIRDRYGVAGGELGQAHALTVRKAADDYICDGCRHVIARGALHGSNVSVHYCACCITAIRPESQFKIHGGTPCPTST